MEPLYLICAGLGAALVVCQFVAGLFGLGTDTDFDGDDSSDAAHDHDGNWFLGMLTFRTVASGLAFFGLAGMAAHSRGLDAPLSLLIALAAGLAAIYIVAAIMRGLNRLKADGTVKIDKAVGLQGSVYLTVPGNRSGRGKITLKLQNRTVEYQAQTADAALPTGSLCVVVAVLGPDIVEVAPVPAEAPTHV